MKKKGVGGRWKRIRRVKVVKVRSCSICEISGREALRLF